MWKPPQNVLKRSRLAWNFSCLAASTATTNTSSTNNGDGATGRSSTPTSSPKNKKGSTGNPTSPTSSGGPSAYAIERNGWAVRPGYSSGASSFSGSDSEFDDGQDQDADLMSRLDLATANRDINISTHSDILALGTLRQEMIADGDLAKAVVRIEVCGCIGGLISILIVCVARWFVSHLHPVL